MARHNMNIPFISIVLVKCFAGVFAANIQINSAGENLLVGLGNRQILDCFVSSDQATSSHVYNWSHPVEADVMINDKIDSTNTSHSILVIDSFNYSHAGEYICRYTAPNGDTNKTSITLTAMKETKMGGVYSFGNESATLSCSLELPAVVQGTFQEWLRDNISVSQLTDHDRFQQDDNGTLFIKNPTRKDGGLYIARYNVTKEYGPYYDCEVIYKAAPLVLDMDKSKNLVEGEQLDLSCSVKGYPPPKVSWFKDGVEIKDGGRVHLAQHNSIENSFLSIKSTQDSDSGKYVCNATDDDGQYSTKSIIIRIKDHLDWLWPVIGIICEAIVLTIAVTVCTKLHNKHHEE